MLATLADAPNDQAIVAAVGAGAFHRGVAYAREGRVTALAFDPQERVLTASVRGSRGAPYRTVVRMGGIRSAVVGQGVSGHCTCPVGVSCKHVAAVLIAARREIRADRPGPPPPAPWEDAIAEAVRPPSPAEPGQGIPIALQVEVVASSPSPWANPADASRPRLRLRPVVPGSKGGWVRTGVSWRDLRHDFALPRLAKRHRDALRALYAPVAGSGRYAYGEVPLELDDVGPSVWPLLEDAIVAGVQLVPVKASGGVIRVVPGGACLGVDLRADAAAGGVTVETRVSFDGGSARASTAWFLGTPVHGIAVLDGPVDGAGPAPGVLLAPLRERTSPQLSRLVRAGSLIVPAADVERFLTDYYPVLRQLVTVTSVDGSVALPEVAPPSLALTLTHAPGHRVRLDWGFDYRVAERTQRVPLTGGPTTGTVRDSRAEARLLAALSLPQDAPPQLREATTDGSLVPSVDLGGMDAVDFLERVLPVLREEAGVVVDEVGDAPDLRFSEAAPLIRVSATDSDDRDWFDLGVSVTVDGEDIPFQQLFVALARGDRHLLLDSGTYFNIERPEYERLRRLIEEARALQDRPGGPPRISRYQVSLWDDLRELGVVDAESERWARTMRGLAEVGGEVEGAPAPQSLDAELRPYQLEGYQWLNFLWEHDLGGVLADDMGLGKTLQTLAAITRAKEEGRLASPVLVVAPTSVVPNWAREAARFAPGLTMTTIGETRSRRGSDLARCIAGADVVITSYALFRIEIEDYTAHSWSALVLDEAQFVKNHAARTYQCARRLAAPVKIAITGTPLENSLMDLWSMLSIVAPGLFPSAAAFTDVYRTPIERDGDTERLATLRRRIRPLLRRRTKEQVAAELPPKHEQVLSVELSPRHRKIYDTHLQRERQKVLGMLDSVDRNRFAIFRSLTLLRQLSLDPALVDDNHAGVGSAKVDALLENLRDVVDGGHRALVFSQFTGFLRVVRERLGAAGIDHVYLDGRTRNRAARVEEFRRGAAPVFLISLKAGGFGLNLTEADYCFVLDPWWNPAVEAQAVDRTHRIGQDKTVMVYRLVAAGTIEEKVMALKARKQDLFDRVIDEDAAMSGPLTADDIRGLFA